MSALTIIFAKEPAPGQVKTRLSPPLLPEDACQLYHAFLEDILEEMSRLPDMALALAYTPAGAGEFFRKLAGAAVRLIPQEGRDLGERMLRASAWGFGAGFQTVLLRGSDTPDLPGALLADARQRLSTGAAQVVLGPSRDGGYYLIGLTAPYPQLFAGMPWSTGRVLEETLKRAAQLSLQVHLLPCWEDIDTHANLLAFLARPHPPRQPGWRSDRTARRLLAAATNSA
jgi:rSAM/selenodomain-associated transferase 1